MIRGALAIFTRDFRKFLSNPFVIITTLMFPIMYLIVFGNAVGGTITHVPIGVVQEGPPYSDTPLFLSAVEVFSHIQPQKDKPRLFDVTVFSDEVRAKRALADGKISGVVVFPSEINPGDPVRLYVDSSDFTTPAAIESGVSLGLRSIGAKNAVNINEIYGKIEYLQFFGVGIIVMAIFMTTMWGGGMALIKDREMGIIEGYLVTPVQRSSIIMGMILSGTVRAFFSGFVIFLVDILITGVIVRTTEGFFLVLLVLIISSVGINSLMVSIASRFSTQQEFSSVAAFLSLFLFMTSSAFYPIIAMPDWLRWVTVINPEYYAIHALRSIILRGQGLNVIAVDLMALIVFSVLMIALGISTFRRTLE
jgi:ABC-2 type transport system permease protein